MMDTCKPPPQRSAADSYPPRLQEIDQLFLEAMNRGLFSGASVLAEKNREVFYQGHYGTCYRQGPAVNEGTRFDLASLTKPLATASCLIHLVSTGRIDLDDPLKRFYPPAHIPLAKKDIRIHQLLNHRSGLPAHRPYYEKLIGYPQDRRKEILGRWILKEPLIHRPGRQSLYSDLGFILLGLIIERVMDCDLDVLFARMVRSAPADGQIGYLRLTSVDTDPSLRPSPSQGRRLNIAATERCPWRRRLLIGEVHDHNAYCLRGVAGHAGLFATAQAIRRWLAFLLAVYKKRVHPAGWSAAVIERFWRPPKETTSSSWVLGYDTPNATGSAAGNRFSRFTIGHLGFTGTSFWMDLEREVIVILLTNSVYPHRHEKHLKRFRPLVHDLIMERIDD